MRGKVVNENAYALILCIIKKMEPEVAMRKMKVEIPYTPGLSIPESEKTKVYNYYYKENLSLAKIGKLYNVSRFTVKNFMDRVGIPTKPKGPYRKNE